MSARLDIGTAALATALESVREELKRGLAEERALTTRLKRVTRHVAALRDAEAELARQIEKPRETGGSQAPARTEAPPAGAWAKVDPDPAARVLHDGDGTSQVARVRTLLSEYPDHVWSAREVLESITGGHLAKGQIDTTRTTLHRLAQHGEVAVVDRGKFRWGGS